ncbi:hypothetical protein [Parendozoicomonas haliclonae]|uniref:Uncharacterized protein n=1 Tax=Parendozoicomonas haliclonae TaxID=1960125 RepID=A0A1X7AHN1_9GAMM|nr:hypothetical protein [Parendozoicomonas haliclonae]SMA43197.1 hypothetical protein EHSB41UT_01567 [Parendozoicomonas haliclonae]
MSARCNTMQLSCIQDSLDLSLLNSVSDTLVRSRKWGRSVAHSAKTSTGKALFVGGKTICRYLDKASPLTHLFLKAPKTVQVPIKYIALELKSFVTAMFFPLPMLCNIYMYILSSPYRTCLLVSACGIPVDSTTMSALCYEHHASMINEEFSGKRLFPKSGQDQQFQKGRCRLAIAMLECMTTGKQKAVSKAMGFSMQLLGIVGHRIVNNTMKELRKKSKETEPAEKNKPKASTESDEQKYTPKKRKSCRKLKRKLSFPTARRRSR